MYSTTTVQAYIQYTGRVRPETRRDAERKGREGRDETGGSVIKNGGIKRKGSD